MKRVLVILAALTVLWIPEYLWAMDSAPDTSIRNCQCCEFLMEGF